jgi:hypothetical protein
MELFNKALFLSQQKIFALTHRRVYILMVNLFQILNQFFFSDLQTIFACAANDFGLYCERFYRVA